MRLCQETYETTKSFRQQIMVEIARTSQDANALARQIMMAATLGQFKAKVVFADKATSIARQQLQCH